MNETMPDALLEEATLNPIEPRLARKQKRAVISSRRRLFSNIIIKSFI